MRYYSQQTGCTYLSGIHGNMPKDVVQISEDLYLQVIANPSPGKMRSHRENRLPYLIEAPEHVADFFVQERRWRDSELAAVVWLRERHRDQLEIEVCTTLSNDQFTELLVYMQAMRDWPQSAGFPDAQHRPAPPSWIAEQAR